ncbi:SDR family NAD(P)-dependent oxidoreductase [Sporomusa aerivorans]|uniref:SDR family NAD(P)-dependent oxidoreductase n=1 Tax=Sporomusa aerivorans TaxID=204936 RepID=UPI00352A8401
MDIRFDGKVAVITGGARGIGYACAEAMVASGAKVALIDIHAGNLQQAVQKLQSQGTVRGYQLNLAKVADISGIISKIREELGEIDVLIQAAGILSASPSEDISQDEWDTVMNVNSRAVFFMMQAVTDQSMKPRKAGSIVNFASIAGVRGMMPPLCSAHYSASKGAVVQLTKQGAVEWGKDNIRVNAVAPGGVMTENMKAPPAALEQLIPLKRLSQPSEIAAGVCFLASDAASMITGQILVIDGGGSAVGF